RSTTRQTPELLQQVLGQRFDVGARIAGEEDYLEQFVIRQIVGPGRDQPLPQPISMTVIMRRVAGSFGQAQLLGTPLADHWALSPVTGGEPAARQPLRRPCARARRYQRR